jgi:hypothetical protein
MQSAHASMIPRHTFPYAREGSGTNMELEYVGAIEEFITLRENISASSAEEKLKLTLVALYSVIDLMNEGKLREEQAAYIVCLNMPSDRDQVKVLALEKSNYDCPEEEMAVRGMSIAYGESRILLARVAFPGRADKWIGISSDEDITGCHVVCMSVMSWGDRLGMVVKFIGPAADVVRRVGATGAVESDEYPPVAIRVPDDE